MRFRLAVLCAAFVSSASIASDHLDGPRVLTNPAADIADLYAWPSADGQRLNLALTVFPNAQSTSKFSTTVQYVFHLVSATTATVTKDIICTFDAAQVVQCWVGSDRYITGDASGSAGLSSPSGDIKLFTGLRNDPDFFYRAGFNNFRSAIHNAEGTAGFSANGCWNTVNNTVSQALFGTLSSSSVDTLSGQQVLAIVLSLDKALVNLNGYDLKVHATTRAAP